MGDLFNQLFIIPILNILVLYFQILQGVGIPFAFGFAIILVTASIRLLLSPLMHKQLASAKKMNTLQPQLAALQKKYKNDKSKLQQEQLRLYKEAGVNPAAGCLPLLIQMPLFLALFRVFTKVLSENNGANAVELINNSVYVSSLHIESLDLNFFGIDLALQPSSWQNAGLFLLLVPVVTAGLQYVQTKQMMGQRMVQEKTKTTSIKKRSDKKTDDSNQDMAQSMQKQMALLSPLMIGFFAYSFPIGLALYWNTFTVFGILQQRMMNRNDINS